MRGAASSERLLAGVAVLAIAAVAIALVAQHGFGMRPCAWCTFQRLIYLALAAAAILALSLRRSRIASVGLSGLAALLAAGGVWAALHQQFVASQSSSCVYTFADRFLLKSGLDESVPWLFEATASCADANVSLAGLPFALWSVGLFTLLLILTLGAMRAGMRTSQ